MFDNGEAGVVELVAGQQVAAFAPEQGVFAAHAEQLVVAIAAVKLVSTGAGDEDVVALATLEVVIGNAVAGVVADGVDDVEVGGAGGACLAGIGEGNHLA